MVLIAMPSVKRERINQIVIDLEKYGKPYKNLVETGKDIDIEFSGTIS